MTHPGPPGPPGNIESICKAASDLATACPAQTILDHGRCPPRGPLEMRVACDGPSLQSLCWIMWELRVRPLLMEQPAAP